MKNRFLRNLIISIFLLVLICQLTVCKKEAIRCSPAEHTFIRVLITGFKTEAPGKLVERYFKPVKSGRLLIKGIELPEEYSLGWEKMKNEIDDFKPDFILSLGLAFSNKSIIIEKTAFNYDPQSKGEIIKGGPRKIESDFPVDKIAEALSENQIPSIISHNGHIYNDLFYRIMYYRINHPELACAFVRMPDWSVDGKSSKKLLQALGVLLEQIERGYRRVAAVEFEPEHGRVEENVRKITSLIFEAKKSGVDLIAFPEMSQSGFVWENPDDIKKISESIDGKNLKLIINSASSCNMWVAFGWPETGMSGNLYNAYGLIDPNSSSVYVYHKHHLYGCDFNWAEAGNEPLPMINTPFGKVSMSICHDVVYPDSYRALGEGKGEILLVGTNWIGNTPITDYLLSYRPSGVMIIVSDRKGSELGTVYPGNTCIVRRDGLVIRSPKTCINGIETLIYSFIK